MIKINESVPFEMEMIHLNVSIKCHKYENYLATIITAIIRTCLYTWWIIHNDAFFIKIFFLLCTFCPTEGNRSRRNKTANEVTCSIPRGATRCRCWLEKGKRKKGLLRSHNCSVTSTRMLKSCLLTVPVVYLEEQSKSYAFSR